MRATYRTAIFALAVLAPVWAVPSLAQNDDNALELTLERQQNEVPQSESAVGKALDEIHTDLIELRFEQALAGIEALLGSNELSEEDRAAALVLRAQGHVAFGDLAAAEEDYRAILALRPGFVPDPSMTPRKAFQRFEKAQAELVGRLILRMLPPDADIVVDDRPVVVSAEGEIALLAGEHRLHASRVGFDAETQTVFVAAGRSASLELRLRPNARSVLVLTEPDGVDVALDGTWVGRTERRDEGTPGVSRSSARLLLENIPLGEHVIELSRACYRTERRSDFLDVDLLDFAPKRYETIRMVPVRSTLAADSGPTGARVLVDGDEVGRFPLDPVELCPGDHRIEVRRGDRRIWSDTRAFREGQVTTIAVVPRPNVLIVGASDWPPALARFRTMVNEIGVSAEIPSGDPASVRTWTRAGLPREVDLVLARRAASREGAPDEWFVYSPILELADRIDLARADLARPRWAVPFWGFSTVDSDVGGPVRVARVAKGGAASSAGLAPGDRISTVGGAAVESTLQLSRILTVASWKAPLVVEWSTREGVGRRAELRASPSVRLEAESPEQAPLAAAWALAESEGEGEWASEARANLALLYSAYGHHKAAAQSWRGVDWEDRPGIGRGTAQYYLGRELELLGQEAEAVSAYRVAARSSSTAVDDEGPPIGPAARDRLADLGADID